MRLFSFFRRASAQKQDANAAPDLPEGVLPLRADEFGFLRPDWKQFRIWLSEQPKDERGSWYLAANQYWLNSLCEHVPGSMALAESKHFLLLHPKPMPERVGAYTELLDRLCLKLMRLLPELAEGPLGKMPVLLFGNNDHYHAYCAYYYPNYGEYGLSGGMFINEGAGHIALPYRGLYASESVIAHELTHACLRNRRLPRWLDEGLAVTFEHSCFPRRGDEGPFEQQRAHRALWTPSAIQRFWRGETFFDPDEHQSRSYELAQIVVGGLSKDRTRFLAFVAKAHIADAGEAAAHELFGFGLGDALAAYLGEGEWGPVLPTQPPT